MTWCQGMQLLVPLSGWCIMYQLISILRNFQQHHADAGLRKCPSAKADLSCRGTPIKASI